MHILPFLSQSKERKEKKREVIFKNKKNVYL